jgi:hypothetical protein
MSQRVRASGRLAGSGRLAPAALSLEACPESGRGDLTSKLLTPDPA